MKKKRESNIELLRIVLMLMIIGHHILVHGLGLKNIARSSYHINTNTYIEILLNSLLVVGVNCFIFISGYFGIKFSIRRVISIIVQAITYSFGLFLLTHLANGKGIDSYSFMKAIDPISSNVWWFITVYLGLYVIAPFLNEGIKELKKTQLLYLLTGLFILNCYSGFLWGAITRDGYNVFSFIFIYLTGRFFNRFEVQLKHPLRTLIFSTLTVAIISMTLLYFRKTSYAWHLFYYNNPLLILSAIALFGVFSRFRIAYNKTINTLATTILGVYMLHDYGWVREKIIALVSIITTNHSYHPIIIPFLLAALVVGIFVIAALIEYLRFLLYNALEGKVTKSRFNVWLKSKISFFIN